MERPSALGWACGIWGLLGVLALLIRPVVSLSPNVLHALEGGLTPLQWVFLVGWVPFMAWSEGYRGFQQRFSPRTAARAAWLMRNPSAPRLVLAPLYCLALVHVRRSTLIARVLLISGIVGLILAVRLLPEPWRGLVDAGVVVGLGWGAVSLAFFAVRTLRGKPPDFDLSLPGTPAPPRPPRRWGRRKG